MSEDIKSVFEIEQCTVCHRNAFSCECPCTCADKECDEYHVPATIGKYIPDGKGGFVWGLSNEH